VSHRSLCAILAGWCLWGLPGQVGAAEAPQGPLPATVTYSEHVAPIVTSQCATCHRPGQAAPFSLLNYTDVRKHAKTMVRVTEERYMPPWQPEPGWGEYIGERRLTDRQIALLKKWVETGMAEGDPVKSPKLPEFVPGWQIGKPDLVVSMDRDYEVPASGPDIYQNFVLPLNLPEDKWVTGIEFRASAPTVVHHVLYFLDNSGRARQRDAEESQPGKPGFPGMGFRATGGLGGWAVGDVPQKLPAGLARPLTRDSDLVLQTHFHPSGKAEKCRLTVGIYFADKPPARNLIPNFQLPPRFGVFSGIDIPPGKADYTVRDTFTLPIDVDLVGINAHAHYIGKSLKLVADLPDKTTKHLFWIKDWDFNWQGTYYYKDFVRLPRGTVLHSEIIWDNSADNPRNPNAPPIHVKWGEGTTDEMGALILLTVPVKEAEGPQLRRAIQSHTRAALRKAIVRGDKLPAEIFRDRVNSRLGTGAGVARSVPNAERTKPAASEKPLSFQDVEGKSQQPLTVGTDRAHVLLFLTHDCPISNGYAPEISSIIKDYSSRGIRFYVVHVDPDFSAEAARKHAQEYHLTCPVLLDSRHQLVQATGVTITPETAVLTPDGEVAYRGRIDDTYPGLGKKRVAPDQRDLRHALDDILAGNPVKVPRTEAVGCSIPDAR
jgi:hypothetical protein